MNGYPFAALVFALILIGIAGVVKFGRPRSAGLTAMDRIVRGLFTLARWTWSLACAVEAGYQRWRQVSKEMRAALQEEQRA